jgi:hypothetical protein
MFVKFYNSRTKGNNSIKNNQLPIFTCVILVYILFRVMVRFMVFNVTFNNISVISWRSVLLVEETRENHRP